MPKTDPQTNGRYVPTTEHLHDLVNREQPAAVNAERGLLSVLMQRPDLYPAVAESLTADSFYHAGYAALYAAVASIAERGGQADPTTLEALLRQKGVLDGLGGTDGLIDIYETEAAPCAELAAERAGVIAECAARRRMADVGARIIHNAHSTKHELAKLVDFAGRDVLELSSLVEGGGATTGMVGAGDLMAEVERAVGEPDARPAGTPTGYPDIDRMVVGLSPGEVVILAARPSVGKTALLLGIARSMASADVPCGIFSLEMSRGQLGERLLSSESGVPGEHIRKRDLTHMDRETIGIASRALGSYPLHIDDTPGLTLMQLRNRARRMVLEHGAQVIFIDYLQLMSDPGNSSRQEEVSNLSRGIKALARELGIAVVCLSQLNRASESRSGNRPRMSDLRESGAIEQDADAVWLLHREDYYHKGEADYTPTNVAEVIIEKQRNGPTGVVRLHWDGSCSRFGSLARESQEYAAQEAGLYDGAEVMP